MALVLPLATLHLPRDPFPPPFSNPISSIYYHIPQSSRILGSEIQGRRLNAAGQLFDEMPDKFDRSSSSSFTSSSGSSRGLVSFERMLMEGLMPDGYLLRSLLERSRRTGEIGLGKQLHGFAIRGGYGVDVGVRIALINMYSDFEMLGDCRRIFYEISRGSLKDGHLWHSVIAAHISNNSFLGAFLLYCEMLSLQLDRPMASTHVGILRACGLSGYERFGMMIHGMILKDEELVKETNLQNCLVTFYAKRGRLEYSNRLFEGIHGKDVASWNAVISANENSRRDDEAIHLFYRMIRDYPFVQPNRVTFLSILSSVSRLGALRLGREIHGYITRSGIASDISIDNVLITMYSRCKEIGKAQVIFEWTLCKDIITWNSMLSAYEQNGMPEKCFALFNRMLLISGLKPDDHSFTIICSAAASESPVRRWPMMRAREIHGYVLRRCSVETRESVPIRNGILKMYSACGCMEYTEKVFSSMRCRDSYSWNALINGYSRNKQLEDAFLVYMEMLELDVEVDYITHSILLTSCSSSVSLSLGKQLHSITLKTMPGSANENALLSIPNSLLSMYSKCGSIGDACKVFSRMERRDVISWTAMITGYAEHGMALESFKLFERMKETVIPNEVTFLGILMACSHGGFVELGTHYFHSMIEDYGIRPSLEHYASMVDLFSRAGELNRAREFLELAITNTRPDSNDEVKLWKVLLSSCNSHKELDLGIEAARIILELAPEDEPTHIILSNLYAMSGLWQDAIKVRGVMQEKELKKEIGCSWIDVKNKRHVFVASDSYHEERGEIYEKLEELRMKVRDLGYRPMTDFVVHDVEETEKEAIVQSHSERLAVAFGLLKRAKRDTGTIRVIKNLRVCQDCHNWMKFTSRVEDVEILLRDCRRFHCFKDGRCSCGDFW